MLNTSNKILIARILYTLLMTMRRLCFLSENVTKIRGGIKWSLHLREGIDLAIYILGGFEVRTLRKYKKLINEGDVVLDIGANIGAHTLPLAKFVGDTGKVIAFEPTRYAFDKLQKNINLNPALSSRIITEQMMLKSGDLNELPSEIYSSWPLENANNLHKDHHGRLMSTQGASSATLDQYVQRANLQRIDLVKLDVDGNEYDVLISGQEMLKKFKPSLIMELSPCVYESCPKKFDGILNLLWDLGYEISEISNSKHFPHDADIVRQLIPPRGSMNALVINYVK